jgi:hypothetical protein
MTRNAQWYVVTFLGARAINPAVAVWQDYQLLSPLIGLVLLCCSPRQGYALARKYADGV